MRIIDPTAAAPLTALGQKLSCDPGLAGTSPAFSDNYPGACPHPRSFIASILGPMRHFGHSRTTRRDRLLHARNFIISVPQMEVCGGVKFLDPLSCCGNLVAFIPRNRSRKAVAPKSSLKVCLGSRTTQCPSFLIYTKLSTFYRTQSDQVSQTIAWQPCRQI